MLIYSFIFICSRSQPPSVNSSLSHQQSFTPLSSLTHRNPVSPVQNAGGCKFIEPLAPDICFDHEWSETLKYVLALNVIL